MRFSTFWKVCDSPVWAGNITSTREVYREIGDVSKGDLIPWTDAHRDLFPAPTADEAAFVTRIFSEGHFQQIIERKKLLKGGRVADPFIIARAAITGATVVTLEEYKINGARIPNICERFGVSCVNLEGFMEKESWVF